MPRLTLRDARELLGWSRARLAQAAGLKASAIYDIEAGRVKNPSHTVVVRLSRALRDGGLRGLESEDLFPVDEAEAKAS